MLRLIAFLIGIALLAAGLAWLADRPGELVLEWQGYRAETSVFRATVLLVALVALALFVWSILRNLWHSPAAVGNVLSKRRQKMGIDALSSGMIALGAGDKSAAMRAAVQARKSLPNEPLTHLLRAQAAQLTGDRTTARRIFEAMLASPDTEQLGLRGLFLEAQRENEREAARHFAERAVALNPKLAWAVDALFDIQCRDGDWAGALETAAIARKNGHIDRTQADRRRAVLLTAQAQAAEETDPERALNLAVEAHGLAPDLVPAAAIAGRMLASRGNTPRAAKILQRTWSRSPHPDLATAYAYARIGDSPRDRLDRVRQLAALSPNSLESPIAVATAAIEARQFDEARAALEPLIPSRMTQRVATLMARIEGEEHGDKGRIREWLARAVNAERDPAWTADGFVAERWMPVSPVSGTLDAFQWRVPVEAMEKGESAVLASKLEELMALGVRASDDEDDAAGSDGDHGARTASAAEKTETKIDTKTAAAARAAAEPAEVATQRTAAPAAPAKQPQAAAQTAAREATATSTKRTAPVPPVQGSTRKRGPGEPAIFVPPHAPDDPGPDTSESDEGSPPLRPQRA
ncbi:MAG TPA: heme biosynthesis HemY N-terminal domain-containing protein [Hyphomicrobium sp.]|nr:heme biosynthesis HemY N-terminal domain-containing protein [Hyphomicrobium sp.]